MFVANAPVEITVLAWSVVLLLVQVCLQGLSATVELGIPYNLSPRDEKRVPAGIIAGRLTRALSNLLETYPAFVVLALALVVTGKAGDSGATGAWIWLAARVFYLIVYTLGIPAIRTIVWCVSVFGLLMMLFRLFS